jgi:hypothetical protein
MTSASEAIAAIEQMTAGDLETLLRGKPLGPIAQGTRQRALSLYIPHDYPSALPFLIETLYSAGPKVREEIGGRVLGLIRKAMEGNAADREPELLCQLLTLQTTLPLSSSDVVALLQMVVPLVGKPAYFAMPSADIDLHRHFLLTIAAHGAGAVGTGRRRHTDQSGPQESRIRGCRLLRSVCDRYA